ncbi:hypothetical protein pb186bvf_015315 [Paramecium bursaria]
MQFAHYAQQHQGSIERSKMKRIQSNFIYVYLQQLRLHHYI